MSNSLPRAERPGANMAKRGELIASIVDDLKKSPHKRSDINYILGLQVEGLQRAIAAPRHSVGRLKMSNTLMRSNHLHRSCKENFRGRPKALAEPCLRLVLARRFQQCL